MSSRPKPRPKPRPRAVVHVHPPSSPPGPSPTETRPPAKAIITIDTDDDEDNLFVRNTTRTAKTWRTLERLEEARERELQKHARDSQSEDEEKSDTSPPHPKRKRKPQPQKLTPDWTKMSADAILILSSDEDDLILQSVQNASTSKRTPRNPERAELRRSRSRSRSITPPPPVSASCIALMNQRIKSIIEPARRPPSPTWLDESTDTIVLDPELADIARQVQSGIYRQRSLGPTMSRDVTPAPLTEELGGPESVTLKVTWVCHPLDDVPRPQSWGFIVKRHDPFKQLYEEVAERAMILSEDLILTLDGKRVFPSASPHGLGVWAEAELEAYKISTFEYIRDSRRRSPSLLQDQDPILSQVLPLPLSQQGQPNVQSDAESDDDKFRLIIRSAVTKDITLTVRPTTKCGAIVKAFLKAAGLPDKYSSAPAKSGKGRGKQAQSGPYLQIDGDKMDPETQIGVAELEDGDQVEIVGL